MVTYFGPIAPYCPVSRDSPIGLEIAPVIRTTVPIARDLQSAIAAVNILRVLVNNLVFAKTINNIHPPLASIFGSKERTSRWKEDKSKRIKRKYKYYATDKDGNADKDTWVMTERIERMVWNDSAWKTSLVFSYGDKGDSGEPVGGGGAGTPGGAGDTG